jgi:hypothetical protein
MFDDRVMIGDERFYPKLGYEKYSWRVLYCAELGDALTLNMET